MQVIAKRNGQRCLTPGLCECCRPRKKACKVTDVQSVGESQFLVSFDASFGAGAARRTWHEYGVAVLQDGRLVPRNLASFVSHLSLDLVVSQTPESLHTLIDSALDQAMALAVDISGADILSPSNI